MLLYLQRYIIYLIYYLLDINLDECFNKHKHNKTPLLGIKDKFIL